MGDQVFIVFNPLSGKSKALKAKEKVLNRVSLTYNVTYAEAASGKEITAKVAEAKESGFTVFGAAGGDGTVAAAAQPLVGTKLPLILLPMGTNNSLAHSFRIRSLSAALQAFDSDAKLVAIDVMKVNDVFSLLSVSSGISSLTMRSHRLGRRILGRARYFFWGLYHLISQSEHEFRLTIDGVSHTVHGHEVIVNNIVRSFILRSLINRSDPMDGRVECYVLKPEYYLASLFTHPMVESYGIHHTFSISTDRVLSFQRDGEPLPTLAVYGEVIPQGLTLRLPAGPFVFRRPDQATW
jgi:diacylglycerol kinase (ATP)